MAKADSAYSTPDIETLFEDYLVAHRNHDDADKLFNQAGRIFRRLERNGIPDGRAYVLAGLPLADERTLRTYGVQRDARERLHAALKQVDVTPDKIRIVTRLCYLDFRREDVANDDQSALAWGSPASGRCSPGFASVAICGP